MDNSPLDRRPPATFGPDGRLTALCGGGALVSLVLTLTSSDAAGRLLFAIGTVLLATYVITDLVFAPRLVVDPDGLTVRAPFTRASLRWAQIDRVRADARQRYGLRSVNLEIDAGDQLIVLSRRALGQDPEFVAEVVVLFESRAA